MSVASWTGRRMSRRSGVSASLLPVLPVLQHDHGVPIPTLELAAGVAVRARRSTSRPVVRRAGRPPLPSRRRGSGRGALDTVRPRWDDAAQGEAGRWTAAGVATMADRLTYQEMLRTL